jgi:hypothetical protein
MTEEIIGMECRWCLSKNLRPVAVGAKARWVLENPRSQTVSNLIKCDDCALVYFDASFSEYELTQMYSGYRNSEYLRRRRKYEPWYTKRINDAIGHSAEVLQLRRQHLEGVLNEALKSGELGLVSPTRVLDVGGDEGQFIPDIETIETKAVLEVSGARPVEGAQVLETWDEAIGFKPDMIMMCHVLEHIENARENIKNAARALEQGGFLYIEIPLDRPVKIAQIFSTRVYARYVKLLCRIPMLFVFADLLSLVSRRFVGRPIPGAVIKQNEHINFFDGLTITNVVESMGFELIKESIYKPSSGVPVLDVRASGTLFVRR